MKLEDLRGICGFHYKEIYSDGVPNHYCYMSYESRGVFQKKQNSDATVGGFCMFLDDCPMKKALDLIESKK